MELLVELVCRLNMDIALPILSLICVVLFQDHHKQICPGIEIPCPNNCGSPLMRRQEVSIPYS